MEAQSTLIEEIRTAQATDLQLERIRGEILVGKAPGLVIHEDGTIRLHNRMCVLTPRIQYIRAGISYTRT